MRLLPRVPVPAGTLESIRRCNFSSVTSWAAASWVIFTSSSCRRPRALRASRTPMEKARRMSARIARASRRNLFHFTLVPLPGIRLLVREQLQALRQGFVTLRQFFGSGSVWSRR